MSNNAIKIIATVIALTLGSRLAMAAPADEANLYAMSLDELMEVEIGIASKQPETVREAPSAVTVFTRNEIQAMGIDNVYDLLNFVPGFQSSRLVDIVDQSQLHSRGLANLNGGVLVLLNGHRLNENSFGLATVFTRTLTTSHVKQVEIIRGPGSALYGSNAFLGVVNIITVTGTNDADLHGGAYDNIGGHANVAKQFGAVNINASLAYDQDRGEEYQRGKDYPQGPSSTRDPRQDLNLYSTLSLRDTKLEVGYMRHENQDFLTVNGVGETGDTWSESAYTLVALSHDEKVSEALSIKGGISFSRHEMSAVGWYNPADPPISSYDHLLGPYTQDSSYEGNLDLNYRIDDESDLMAGLFNRHEGTDFLGFYTNYLTPNRLPAQADPFYLGDVLEIEDVPSFDGREEFLDNYGIYAQYRRDLSATLHGIAGLRFDRYDVSGATLNPRLGLIWELSQDTTLKAFWGNAFRSPNLTELYTDTPRALGNLALQPETIETTELVCQQRFRSIELEGVYFHNNLNDIIERQTPVSASDPRKTWGNGGEQDYDGLEARIIWDPIATIRFTLTHTHIFSDLAENTYDDFSSFIVDYHSGRWRLNINGIYRDQQENGLENQNDTIVTNAKLSYAFNKTVTLYSKADNLFDYQYQTVESDTSTTYYDAVPNQGLRWMLGMEAEW